MASSAAVAAAAEPALVPLQFDQPLKGCSNAELQKRLRALHEELSDMDQDVVDTSSIDSVARALIQHSLLLNKEKGVKAYLACCLADVLRLYAPDAPYSKAEIKVSLKSPFATRRVLDICGQSTARTGTCHSLRRMAEQNTPTGGLLVTQSTC